MLLNSYLILSFIFVYLSILLNKIKEKELLLTFFFLLIYFSFSFRGLIINDDNINYFNYFNNVFAFDSFSDFSNDLFYEKVEIGFKLLIYISSFFSKIFESNYFFKLIIILINISLFISLYNSRKKIGIKNFEIFLFFYVCFHLLINDLAIVRFSISFLLLILGFQHFFFHNKSNGIFIIFIASLFHYSILIFSLMLLYFDFFLKRNKYFFILIPFVFVMFIIPIISNFSPFFGDYYLNLLLIKDNQISFRILLEIPFILIVIKNKKFIKYQYLLKLILVLYLFFSFLEVYNSIEVFNRFRIIAWFLFLNLISFNWNSLNLLLKSLIIFYSITFFSSVIYGLINNPLWN